MSRDFSTEISKLETELAEARGALEQIKVEFLASASVFLEAWFPEQAKREVRYHAEEAKSLGSDRMGELKAAVSALAAKASQIVARFLDVPNLWWHMQPEQQSYFVHKQRLPEHIDTAFRLAAGSLAEPLTTFGVLRVKDRDEWKEYDRSGNRHPVNARSQFPGSMDYPADLVRVMEKYDQKRGAASRAEAALQSLRKDKSESEAMDLWEKA